MNKREVPAAVFESFEGTANYRKAHNDACKDLDLRNRYSLDEGNPNHPIYDNKLFGYAVDEFLKKQY